MPSVLIVALAVIGMAAADPQGQLAPPVIDNIVTAAEWEGATIEPLSGGGRVSALRRGDVLYLAVESPSAGFANVCIGGDSRVRLLHASAALGDITFERRGDAWRRLSEFEWALRDSPRAPAPSAEQVSGHLDSRGWLAKASARPNTVREFAVRIGPGESRFAATFVDTGEPNRVLAAPASLDDACADLKLAQGWVPETAAFAPERWLRVDPAPAIPASGQVDRAWWAALRDRGFALPEGGSAYDLLSEMRPLLASTDPFLRDNVAYEATAKWIYTDKLLTPDEQRRILAAWTANLRSGIGETGGDAAFLRSFSALALSIVAARENAAPFLTQEEFDAFAGAMIAYLADERDTRGFDRETGWVHATAHTADVLKFLARSPKLDVAGQARLLHAIDAECASFGQVFQWAEDERLAQVIVSIMARPDFDKVAFDAWLATIPPRRKAVWANAPAIDSAKYAEVQNLTLILRASHAALAMAARLTPELEAARASIIATLRAMR